MHVICSLTWNSDSKWLVEMTIPFLQSLHVCVCACLQVKCDLNPLTVNMLHYFHLIHTPCMVVQACFRGLVCTSMVIYQDTGIVDWLIANIMLWLLIQYKGAKQSTICSRFLQGKLYHTAEYVHSKLHMKKCAIAGNLAVDFSTRFM